MEVVSFNTVVPTEEMTLGESMKAFMTVLDRNIQLGKEIKELKEEIHDILEDKKDMETFWEVEHDEKVLAKDKVHELKHEGFELRKELKAKKQKIGKMSYIHRSSHEDYQRQVAGYPVETGQTRHTISRDVAVSLADANYANAIRQM